MAAAAGMGGLLGGLPIGAARAQGQPKRGGTLRVASVDKPVNMDPGYAQLYSSLQIYQNVFNKLVYVDETGQFIPGLAKSWKQENDKTWLFDLVDNAVFHNGEPFTAKDVAFTFSRILDAKNKLPMRVFFTPVEGVEAVGSHQVRFHLNKPWGPMLATLAQATEMVNEKALQAKDPKLFPIGTGPYKFVEWVKDDHVTIERWDKYFRPSQPYIDRIIFQRARRRHRAPHRAADGEVQLDPDGAAAAHPRAGARARHEVLAGPAVLSVLLLAEREPAARSATSASARPSRGRSTARRS